MNGSTVGKFGILAVMALALLWPGAICAQDGAAASGQVALAKSPLAKGAGFVTLTLDYKSTKKENINSFLEDVLYSNEKDGRILLGGGWFFKENAAVGLGFSLGKTTSIKETQNLIGPSTITEQKTRLMEVAPFIRYYLPIGSGHRFFLLNQLECEYAHESGNETKTTGPSETLSTLTKNSYGLVFTPGLVVLVVEGFALEVTVGVGGIKYGIEKRRQEDAPDGVIKTTNFDLRIDILKLKLGFSYYF